MSEKPEGPKDRRYREHARGRQRNIKQEIEDTVEATAVSDSIRERTNLLNDMREWAVAEEPDFESWRDQARAIKEDAIDRIPELIDQVTEVIEDRGGHVYVAETPEEANEYIRDVCDDGDAELVVKSKSMTTEEIELNETLERDFEVVETDLGEFVAQLSDERPSHIIGPIIHKPQEEIVELFQDRFDFDIPDDVTGEGLTKIARDVLREKFEGADVGITGANFVIAETGSVVLVTNEGNARWTTEAPHTHIAVAGIEKIIPEFEDLQPFYELLPKSATGQPSTSYFTMLTPPIKSESIDYKNEKEGKEREFHLVLIDNGRTEMAKDPALREALYCIRCGACLNTCANFQSVGGHVYGGETYTGGIGNAWEAGVTGKDEAEAFNELCTGCSQCKPACPVKIDIPWLNTVIRDRLNRDLERDDIEGFVFEELLPEPESQPDRQRRFFGTFERRARTGSRLAPLSNWVGNSFVGKEVMNRLYGFAKERDMPGFASQSFTSEWEGSRIAEEEANRKAVLFADAYSNYLHPERLEAAAELMESAGVHVEVAETTPSGRDALSQGLIEDARRDAEKTFENLHTHIQDGRDVVVVEPSVASLFMDEYSKLLDEDEYRALEGVTFEVGEYLNALHDEGHIDLPEIGGDVYLHGHCQQRAGDHFGATEELLRACGCNVTASDVECCGMAGSFGYKEDYYELAVSVGESLFEDVESNPDKDLLACGTSCTTQIKDGTGRKPRHPVEYIVEYL
ncbi:MAG: LUD domain-containing protein [Halobacteria archaeon]|nr:LUD domain-containing protein [Halobacteria archaeon]